MIEVHLVDNAQVGVGHLDLSLLEFLRGFRSHAFGYLRDLLHLDLSILDFLRDCLSHTFGYLWGSLLH